MDIIMNIVTLVNAFLWKFALLFLLCGTGVYYTFRLKFVQIRKFKDSFRTTFGQLSLKGKKAGDDGMSSFQALATAIAAQVGTGNLAGAATAIVSGGPGAIFWMWVSAFFGMATIFAEATLAQEYKTTVNGKVTGGPVYYIKAAFQGKTGKILAASFSTFIILALGFMGNMVQSNSISESFAAFGIKPLYIGILIAMIAAFVFLGGVRRIASLTEKIVPIMASFYIIGAIAIIAMNYQQIGHAFSSIIIGAFSPSSIAGGVLGITVRDAIRYGVARGLFSNEAGMGSTPHAHAIAKVKHPCEQGKIAMMGVFIDTFVILNLTALVILTSGASLDGHLKGVALTQTAFNHSFGNFGGIFVAICMLFFGFSTIISWYFFAEANVRYLFGTKATRIYTCVVLAFIVLGSILKVDMVWELADMFNGLMVIPNLLGLLALSPVVSKLAKELRERDKHLKL